MCLVAILSHGNYDFILFFSLVSLAFLNYLAQLVPFLGLVLGHDILIYLRNGVMHVDVAEVAAVRLNVLNIRVRIHHLQFIINFINVYKNDKTN